MWLVVIPPALAVPSTVRPSRCPNCGTTPRLHDHRDRAIRLLWKPRYTGAEKQYSYHTSRFRCPNCKTLVSTVDDDQPKGRPRLDQEIKVWIAVCYVLGLGVGRTLSLLEKIKAPLTRASVYRVVKPLQVNADVLELHRENNRRTRTDPGLNLFPEGYVGLAAPSLVGDLAAFPDSVPELLGVGGKTQPLPPRWKILRRTALLARLYDDVTSDLTFAWLTQYTKPIRDTGVFGAFSTRREAAQHFEVPYWFSGDSKPQELERRDYTRIGDPPDEVSPRDVLVQQAVKGSLLEASDDLVWQAQEDTDLESLTGETVSFAQLLGRRRPRRRSGK
jgi:hypothetical protein